MAVDIGQDLEELQKQTLAIKRLALIKRTTRWRYNHRSRLDRWAAELITLHRGGATNTELQRWLRQKHRIKVAYSTVKRWIDKHGQVCES